MQSSWRNCGRKAGVTCRGGLLGGMCAAGGLMKDGMLGAPVGPGGRGNKEVRTWERGLRGGKLPGAWNLPVSPGSWPTPFVPLYFHFCGFPS